MKLDHVDHHILDMLAQDARVSMAALAEATHLSRAAVHSRFSRLKNSGVIARFTIRLNPGLTGAHASAYIQLTVVPQRLPAVHELLCQIAEVEYCARVSGSCDLLALVRATTVNALGREVIDRIHVIPGVQSTRTLIVFDEWERGPCTHPHDGEAGCREPQ